MNEKQYVLVKIEYGFYAIDISKVNSITQAMQVTKIPNASKYAEGVIDLRGAIVPVVNLRCLFNLTGEYKPDCRIIVYKHTDRSVGILVDEASEVIFVGDEDIDDARSVLGKTFDGYISGIAKVKNRIVVILDLEKVIELVS